MLLYHPENIGCQNTGLFYTRDSHYGRYLPVVYSEIHLQYYSQHSLFNYNECVCLYHGGYKADAGRCIFVAVFMSHFLSSIDSVTETLGYNYDANDFTGASVNIFGVLVMCVPLVLSLLQREKIYRSEDSTMNIIVSLMMVTFLLVFLAQPTTFPVWQITFWFSKQLPSYGFLSYLLTVISKGTTDISMVWFAAYFYYGEYLTNGGFDLNFDSITFW